LTFIYLNLDNSVAMHKKGLCKKASSCGTNRKTCYHISGRSIHSKTTLMYYGIDQLNFDCCVNFENVNGRFTEKTFKKV
jgi:hypothetical protein